MATLKCLACGQENKVGDESCAACSSSLNLKLCSACEAVNASAAKRCHACGAEFGPEAAAPAAVEESTVFFVQAVAEKSLPATRRLSDAPRAPARRGRAVAWTLAIALAAGAGYAYYRHDLPALQLAKDYLRSVIGSAIAPTPAPAKVVEPTPPAPVAVSAPKPVAVAESAPPPAPLQTPPKTAKSGLAQATRPAEAKRAPSPVTHTRGGTAPAAAAAAPAIAPAESAAAPAPVAARPVRVTHTKASEPGEAPAVAASAAVLSQPRIDPVKDQPGCPPAVAALGLCISK